MELEIIIEKVDDDIHIPIKPKDVFQVREDGILLNGALHFWEEILTVMITNRELLERIKYNKEICAKAPFPDCNGANGCDTCEHNEKEVQ